MLISFTGVDEAESTFSAMPEKLHDAILVKTAEFAEKFTQKLSDDALSGGILQSKTGALKNSITNTLQDTSDIVNDDISVGEGLSYAGIQEYGGTTTKAHIIEVINAKALAFKWQGKTVFFRKINHPGSVIPAHDFMQDTIDATEPDLVEAMQDAVAESTL